MPGLPRPRPQQSNLVLSLIFNMFAAASYKNLYLYQVLSPPGLEPSTGPPEALEPNVFSCFDASSDKNLGFAHVLSPLGASVALESAKT